MDENKKTMKVEDAAKILGVAAQHLRIGLQRDKYPFGTAVDQSGKGRYRYHIFPERLKAYIEGRL